MRTIKIVNSSLIVLFLIGILWGQKTAWGWMPVYKAMSNGAEKHFYGLACDGASPCLWDMDEDGDLDLILGRALDYPAYYRNDGTPSNPEWTEATDSLNLPALAFTPQQSAPCVGDLDRDGDPDLLIGINSGKTALYLMDERTSEGFQWTLVTENLTTNALVGTARPALLDVDFDGDLDLFIGKGNGEIALYKNLLETGTLQWVLDTSFYNGIDISSPANPCFFDYDGDGLADLFIGDAAGNIHYYPGYGLPLPGQFYHSLLDTNQFANINVHKTAVPCFGDLNKDGKPDLVVGNEFGKLLCLMQGGSGPDTGWIEQESWNLPVDFVSSSVPELADLDNDQDLDLFVAVADALSTGGYAVRHLRNNGVPWLPDWEVVDPSFLSLSYSEMALRFVDIDNDDDLDLYVGNLSNTLYFYENQGTPEQHNFIATPSGDIHLPANHFSIRPCFADMEGDGTYDLWVVGMNFSGGFVFYYENTGSSSEPTFSSYEDWTVFFSASSFFYPSMDTGYMNQDAIPDLIFTESPGNVILYHGNHNTPPFGFDGPFTINLESSLRLPSICARDVDGNGYLDLILGDSFGSLHLFQNDEDALGILPGHFTTAVNKSIQFNTYNGSAITWASKHSESGGSIHASNGTYTAGSQKGLDIIEATSADGKKGLAYVNVLEEADLSASGKAVVLAGRKANDPLWETTNELAHFVYRMLLYRGFSPENVLYLNPETDQDVNGDGDSGNDIDLPSTHANIQEGLTNFASGSPNLFVYLIDHGDADPNGENGFIRCNESDVLYAAELDDWLDNLQAHHGVTTLTLVVDCCTAGAFLKDCAGAPTGCNRVVVCSSGATQPSVFTAGGLISFTHAFVNALYSGLPLGHAFDLGAGAMDRYQQPIMDDDGDGIYNKDLDGTVADALTVGASYIAGADRPQIGNIVPNQTLSGGNTEATLWASGVSGVYPVERVWATIAEPGLIGRAQLDPSNPISNLPEVDLTWNETNQRYEATTNTFTSLGAYAVNFYAKDIWGGIAFPKQTYIAQGESDEEGIILCGDGDYDSNSPWAYSDYLAGAAYETMRSRWIKPDRIQYLSSGSRTGIDDTPTEDHLSSAIAAAVGQSQVTLYMVGRGSAGAFDVDGDGVASDADDVTPAELDAMLDALQTAEPTSPTRVVVVLDFTESGDWTAPLKAPAGKERIIVTSCRAGQKSWCEEGGVLSFSRWFLSQVFNGANVRDAFNWSRTALYTITGYTQLATLDDDGSGRADRGDGTLAFETYIGAAFVTGSEAPEIGSVAEIGPLSGTSETLWAAAIRSAAGLDEVFAYVVRPGADAENDAMDRVDLAYDSAAGRWEASYDQFDPSLHQDIIYFAVDRDGQISEPVSTHVEPSGSEDLYDRLFNDDTTETLNFFSEDNWEQTHNFWAPGDEDWAIFNADAGQSYEIRVRNQAINCDGAIALYHESDLETPLVEWDFWGPGGADEILVWDSNATTGTIFVKVSQSPYSSHLNGSATTYTLQVFSGWGANAGLATISGTLVYMSANSAGGTLNVSSEGYYSANSLSIPPGALTEPAEFLIRSPGDSGNYPYFPSTQMWQNAHPHSASIMQVLSTLEETPLDSFFLTMEFLDGVTADNGFLIDDVPDGFPTSKMRIFWWTGEQWEIVPGVQTVVGNTVSVYLNQLGPTLLDSYLFAVGPGPLETREVAFSLPNSTVSETDSSCEVEVVVSASAAHNETFTYTTEGTAQSGEDYTTLSGSLVLEDGKTTAVITVTLNNDVHVEENETLELTLTGGNEGTLPGSPDRHILTIESEDVPDSGNSLVPTVRWMLYE